MQRNIFLFALLILILPASVSAAFEPLTPSNFFPGTLAIGDLVKRSSDSAVYYLGADGKRHVFPHDSVYFSWYADFSKVKTVSDVDLAAVSLGANITYRPGYTMVKIPSNPTVYAVARGGLLRAVPDEPTARALYGNNWAQKIRDVSEAFWPNYKVGESIINASDFSPGDELAVATTINIDKSWEVDHVFKTVTLSTTNGSFTARVAEYPRSKFDLITDTAELTDCDADCAVKSLVDYVSENGGEAGMHGTYFCPPDYADCAGKVNTFLSPVYNSDLGAMINNDALAYHEGPIIAQSAGELFYFHRTKEMNLAVTAAISNYPSLVENGTNVSLNDPRLEDAQKTVKGVRGGMGFNDQYIFLVITEKATVPDLAAVLVALGASNAINLDGGGSAALYTDGKYQFGPGRLLPNAVILKRK